MENIKIYNLDEFRDQKSKIDERIQELMSLDRLTDRCIWSTISKYCSERREFIVKDDGDTLRLYVTTGTGIGESNSILVTAKKGSVQVSDAVFNRVGNGVNQLGVVKTDVIFDDGDDRETKLSYMISTKSNNDDWFLSYNFYGSNGSSIDFARGLFVWGKQSIVIDGKELNLDGNFFISDPDGKKSIEESMNLFRRKYIKGDNLICGETKHYDTEDLSFLGIEKLTQGKESKDSASRSVFTDAEKRIANNDVAAQEHPSPVKAVCSELRYTLDVINHFHRGD